MARAIFAAVFGYGHCRDARPRYFLDKVASWILELDRGEGIPFKGNYTAWLEQKARRLEQEEKADQRRKKALERELECICMSPRARQAKGKARLHAYDKLASETLKEKERKLELTIPPGRVSETSSLKSRLCKHVLFEHLSF